jgi:hypothetical protein
MMTDYSGSGKGGRPPWHGAHWIPVIVIAVILMSGRTTPDESGTLLAALLGALGWGFGPGGRPAPPLPA